MRQALTGCSRPSTDDDDPIGEDGAAERLSGEVRSLLSLGVISDRDPRSRCEPRRAL
jgi:hypothetical protein